MDELQHYGVLGMKWGVRRSKTGYQSTSVKSWLARKKNDKVDAGFKDWQDNTKKRDKAIELGKKAIAAQLAYEKNKSDKSLKSEYKKSSADYKKALGENTTYRKGVVRQEVGKDAARKHLSYSKELKKRLAKDPSNKALQKELNETMSKYDVEREKARRAVEVGSKRSRRIASIKRGLTMSVKTVAGAGTVAAGTYAVNRYLNSHNTTINGKRVVLGKETISSVVDYAKKIKELFGYAY